MFILLMSIGFGAVISIDTDNINSCYLNASYEWDILLVTL